MIPKSNDKNLTLDSHIKIRKQSALEGAEEPAPEHEKRIVTV